MKNSLSWLKNKKQQVTTILVAIIIFILSFDFWAWNKAEPLILGLPFWVYYMLFLTISLAIFFYIISKNVWSEN